MKRTTIINNILVILCVLSGSFAFGQNQLNLGELKAGEIVLNMSVTEQEQVEQDTLVIYLEYSAQGKDKIALQNEVNTAIAKALDLLEETSGIEYATRQYQVYSFQPEPQRRNDIEEPAWRAQQGIELSSLDSTNLLEITGTLQESGLYISSMRYTLSDEKYEEVSAELTVAALQRLQGRAEAAATALNKSTAQLIEVSMNAGPNFGSSAAYDYDPRVMRSAALMESPVAEAGETQVSINISARAVLSP